MAFFIPRNEVMIVPHKPKRPCSYPGCSELVNGRYCDKHQRQVNAHYNKYERNPAHKKLYGRAWKRIRDRYIKDHPLCEECHKRGKVTLAAEVHHIKPLSQGGTNDNANLMALCTPCHSEITAREGGRWGR